MKARLALLYATTVFGVLAAVNSAPAQGTAFTYQGCLKDSGAPAGGSYDLQFTLYNDATNLTSIGVPVTLPATAVSNGLFTVTLDFGSGLFNGQPLWLGIGVRTNGGQTGFFTLSPRQPLTSAPYAVTAANLTGTLPAAQLTGSLPTSQLTGTFPASQLTGLLPTSQLSGTIPVSSIVGAQPANVNLAANLTYTNYDEGGQALLPVTIGDTYIYFPTKVGGVYDGTYVLGIVGTNRWDDTNWFCIDPGNVGIFPPLQTNQIFVATQNTVTFVNKNASSGPVTDSLYDLAGVTINGTVNGVGQFSGVSSGTFAGNVTNSTLAGNAQGGAVTNLDYSINNLNDNNGSAQNIISRLSSGGVIYVPNGTHGTNVPISVLSGFGGVGAPSYANPLLIYGNGSGFSALSFTGGNTNLIDQFNGPFGLPAVDLRGITLNDANFVGGVNDIGYVSAPGCSGFCDWNDVCLNQFLIGACTTSSDGRYWNMQLENNNVGFILAPYSDASFLDISRAFGNTNADAEIDSRGDRIFADLTGANIGVLLGGGGSHHIQMSAEVITNAGIAIGYPSNWPFQTVNSNGFGTQFAGTQWGNDEVITAIEAGWGYTLVPPASSGDVFAYDHGAFVKVWNTNYFGGAHLTCEALNAMEAVVSYTGTGDNAPYFFDFITVGQTNLMTFSDGTSIPSEDGSQVGVNLPELEFTKNVLEYSRDKNGNLYAAGNITSDGVVSASTGHFGSLTVTGAATNALFATDPGGNVTGITIGSGLTLSGGTLSAPSSAGTSVNTYTANHVATAQDGTILVNGHGLTITLPDASVAGSGRSYIIKLISNSPATVATTSSQTIDGNSSYALSSLYKYVMVQSDGAQWWIVGNN